MPGGGRRSRQGRRRGRRRRSRPLPPVLALLAALAGLAAACGPPDAELSDRELYSKYCSDCHGEDGRGAERFLGEPGADLVASEMVRSGDREQVARRIAWGKGPMPAYERKLAPADFERLVEFVMDLSEAEAEGGG